MKIISELLEGVFVLKNEIYRDTRGSLSVPFNVKKFSEHIGPFSLSQTMYTLSSKSVLRGLHYQNNSCPISKLVSCLSGAIYDVVVDLRRNSTTFGQWAGIHLDETDSLQVFVPAGVAHGFMALAESSSVFYYQSGDYSLSASRILKWNDPDLGITWPVETPILSDRDKDDAISWQDYKNNPSF